MAADPATSFLIGDKDSDIEAARRQELKAIFTSGISQILSVGRYQTPLNRK